MADNAKKLAVIITSDTETEETEMTNNDNQTNEDKNETEAGQQKTETNNSNDDKKNDNDNLTADDRTESRIRKQSIKERTHQLRIISDQMITNSSRNLDPSISPKKKQQTLQPHSSSLITRVTSILIDELNDDTQQFETCQIELPKSPICALLLMESVGVFQTLEKVNQLSIVATIVITILIQTIAGGTLFVKQIYSEVQSDNDISTGFMNVVVVSFVVIYLSQDCAQIYKMVILLRWMHHAGKLKRHSAVLIALYLVANFLFYIFLMYYSVVELMINDDISLKLQAAVAVYFILELDDWLYNVTIEPLKILDDEIFTLVIKGQVGSRNRRFKKVTYWFWGIFFLVTFLQFMLFFGKVQDSITFAKDDADDSSTCSCCCNT